MYIYHFVLNEFVVITFIFQLDIVGQNKVTGERDIEVKHAEVTGLTFSKSGAWMATVEQRLNSTLDEEIKLKFWNFDAVDQKYNIFKR